MSAQERARQDVRSAVRRLEDALGQLSQAEERLAAELADRTPDTIRLDWLEETVRRRRQDVLIRWDHEDGYWLAVREPRGRHAAPLSSAVDVHDELREAIDAARKEEP